MTGFGIGVIAKATARLRICAAALAVVLAWPPIPTGAVSAGAAVTAPAADKSAKPSEEDGTAITMKLTKAEGPVSILSASDKKLAVREKMRLYNGYQVHTGEEGYAWVALDNVKLVKVDAFSKASLRKRGKKLEILLESGNVFFNVSEPLAEDETLNIRTSTMLVGIRGTSGWVEAVRDEKLRVSVLEGTVTVRVTDPVTRETKTERVTGGETAVCEVDRKAPEGEACTIEWGKMEKKDVRGFVLEEVAVDAPFAEKIYEKGGPDLRRVTPQEAQERIKQDEQELHIKVERVEAAVREQEAKSAIALVWGDGSGQPQGQKPDSALGAVSGQALASAIGQVLPGQTQQPADGSADTAGGDDDDDPTDPAPAPDEPAATPKVQWAYNNATDTLTISGSGRMEGYTADSPPPWSAYRDRARRIVVEEGVTGIGSYAFSGCSKLTSVTIPEGVADIGLYAFSNCSGLKNVYFGGTYDRWTALAPGTFFSGISPTPVMHYDYDAESTVSGNYDSEQKTLFITGSGKMEGYASAAAQPWSAYRSQAERIVVGKGITCIGSFAFYGFSNVTDVVLPAGLRIIDSRAFYNCSKLNSITIPGSVAYIGSYAFAGCKALTGIQISEGNGNYASIDGVLFSADKKTLISCPVGRKGKYQVPDTVTSIEARAFFGCNGLTEVALPKGLVSISNYAFQSCIGLQDIKIPDGVTNIGTYAFSGCKALTKAVLPAGLTSLGGSAFYMCSGLRDVYFGGMYDRWASLKPSTLFIGISPAPVVHYDYDADSKVEWDYVSGSDTLRITGSGKLEGYASADSQPWKDYQGRAKQIEVGEGITCIGSYAFAGFGNVTDVTLPAGLCTIDTRAFADCGSLKTVWFNGTREDWDALEKGSNVFDRIYPQPYICAAGGAAGQVQWSFDRDSKTLRIFGSGQMKDYDADNHRSPWSGSGAIIEKVVVEEGAIGIGNYAFNNCTGLKSITLPGSVVSIGEYAFAECYNLEQIALPSGLTSIGDCAFYYSGLTEIKIPNSVTSIGEWAFGECYELEQIELPSGLKTISAGLLVNCPSLTSVEIPSNVTSIGESAFYGSGLTEIKIPNSVTSIGEWAFGECYELEQIELPDGLKAISAGLLGGCTSLTSVKIPDNVTSIGESAFYGSGLTGVEIPSNVTSIGESAFAYCVKLGQIELPSGLKSISAGLLRGCTGLSSFTISGNVTDIGDNAFSGSGLTAITIPDNVADIGEYAFAECVKLAQIELPSGLAAISAGLLKGCTILTSVELPDNVTSIGASAFSGSGLTAARIPQNVADIGNSAFSKCSGLTEIKIPDNVTSIGEYAFAECVNLAQIELPSGLKAISAGLLSGCTGLSSVKIPGNVTDIGKSAFSGSGLTAARIPGGVANIGASAFSKCSSLRTVMLSEGVAGIGDYAFYQCRRLSGLVLPESVTSVGRYAFSECYDLAEITIAGSAVGIGDYAFYLSGFLKVTISGSVRSIGSYAFAKCYVLAEITLPIGLESIGSYAFSECSGLKDVYFEGTSDQWSALVQNKNVFYYSSSVKMHYDSGITEPDPNPADGILWSYESGTLTISGNGSMRDYTYSTRVPWNAHREEIQSIVVKSGVTRIGNYAFYDCSSLTSVTLPEGLKSIGSSAFSSCSSLTDVYWFGTPDEWSAATRGDYIFPGLPKIHYMSDAASLTGDVRWSYESGTLTVSGNGKMGDYTEKSPPPWNIYRGEIQSIVVAEGVTYAGNYAFYGCSSVTSVTLPESLESIGDGAFYDCSKLTSIAIPSSVVSVGDSAFYNCRGLTSVTLSGGVVSIGDSAFESCSSLIAITFPEGLKSIGHFAFSYCWNLKEIRIPAGVTSIGSYAFNSCSSLTSIEIPASVTSIGSCAFYDSGLTDVYWAGTPDEWSAVTKGYDIFQGLTKMHYAFGVTDLTGEVRWSYRDGTLTVSGNGKMGDYTEKSPPPWNIYRGEIQSIVVAEGVTYAGNYAFYGCSAATSVTLPGSLESIGSYAFYGCSKLTSIEIPGSVTSIGAGALSSCSGLTSVAIPGSVTSIDDSVFYGCGGLTSVTIPGSVVSIGDSAFRSCSKLTSIEIPDSVTSIGDSAFRSCSKLTSIEIPNSVTSIDSYAFYNCDGLTDVYWAGTLDEWSTVTKGYSIFPSLAKLHYESGAADQTGEVRWSYEDGTLTVSGNGKMGDYTSSSPPPWNIYKAEIRGVVVEQGVTHIGNYAFYGCSGLKSIAIPEGGTSIGDSAFYGCSGLTSITIPEDVAGIGQYAFYDCRSLKDVYFEGSPGYWAILTRDKWIFSSSGPTMHYFAGAAGEEDAGSETDMGGGGDAAETVSAADM